MQNNKERVVRTTVWSSGAGCHGGCGVKLHIKNNQVVKVEGDEDHPYNQGRLCSRCLALTQYMYHPDRIKYPMKRVGERGEGKWERISWDEAYEICEKKLKEIRDQYGAESVIFCQGTGRDIGGPITYLMYNYGSPNWVQLGLVGHSCATPRMAAQFFTQGETTHADASEFLEKRYDDPRWTPPKVIINWAKGVANGCTDGFFTHWIVDCMKRGSKLIVVDPRSPWIAGRADIHLQIRPGTDGALGLAMLNVIINEELYDKEFVEKWCYGFEELKQRVQEYSPEKMAPVTWIPKEQIIEAARLFATSKPAFIQWGQPLDSNPQTTAIAQAIDHIFAITGNIDVPGGMVPVRSPFNVHAYPIDHRGLVELYGEEFIHKMAEKRIGTDRYPMFKNFRGWAQPDMVLEQLETGKPYPIKAAWIQTSNILGGQAADPKRHYNALKKLDFVVVVDLFLNSTSMALADIVLPAATFPEKESMFTLAPALGVLAKAVDGGECKSDWEINFEMARRLSLKPIPYKTVKELLDDRLKPSGLSYDELVAKGSWAMPSEGAAVPYYRYEKGILRKDGKPGFDTPTGKVELWSTKYEDFGLDPLPYFEEPPESPISTPELYKEYPLILMAGLRSPVFFHSEHRMIPCLREIDPDPTVEIHPTTAEELGIIHGEWVYIENKRGRVKAKAKVTPIANPKVIACCHGWWLPETDGKAPNLFGTWDYNINNLVPSGTQGRSGFGGATYRNCLCRVVKIKQ